MAGFGDTPTAAAAIDAAPFGPLQFRIALLCAIVAGLDGLDTQAIAYVAPAIGEDWGIDKAAFGPVFGMGLFGLTLGALLIAPLADRIGRKSVILISTALFGLCAALTALATNIESLLAYRFVTGIGLGAAMPNLIALTNEYAPRRLKATLVTVMFCGFPLGSTLGGLVSAPLISTYGWQSVFVLGGALPLLILPLLYALLPESVHYLARRPGTEGRIAAILARIAPGVTYSPAAPSTGKGRIALLDLFAAGRARATLLLWVAFFMNLLVMYFLVNWLPSLLRGAGLPLGLAILSTAVLNLGGVAGAIMLGRMIDRGNATRILSTAYAGSAVFIAVIACSGTNVAMLLAGTALAGVTVVGAQIGLNAVAAGMYPTAMRSTGVGWALGIGRVGSVLGPVAGGLLLGIGWSTQSLILAAAPPALIAALAVFLIGDASRPAAEDAA